LLNYHFDKISSFFGLPFLQLIPFLAKVHDEMISFLKNLFLFESWPFYRKVGGYAPDYPEAKALH